MRKVLISGHAWSALHPLNIGLLYRGVATGEINGLIYLKMATWLGSCNTLFIQSPLCWANKALFCSFSKQMESEMTIQSRRASLNKANCDRKICWLYENGIRSAAWFNKKLAVFCFLLASPYHLLYCFCFLCHHFKKKIHHRSNSAA